MARVVDERPERSSWFKDEWLDGRPWLLKQGEDFDVTLDAARRQIQRKAAQQNLTVEAQIDNEEHAVYVKASRQR